MKELKAYLVSNGISFDNLSKEEYHTLELLFFNYKKYSRLSLSQLGRGNYNNNFYGNLIVSVQGYKKLLDNYIYKLKNKPVSRQRLDLQN